MHEVTNFLQSHPKLLISLLKQHQRKKKSVPRPMQELGSIHEPLDQRSHPFEKRKQSEIESSSFVMVHYRGKKKQKFNLLSLDKIKKAKKQEPMSAFSQQYANFKQKKRQESRNSKSQSKLMMIAPPSFAYINGQSRHALQRPVQTSQKMMNSAAEEMIQEQQRPYSNFAGQMPYFASNSNSLTSIKMKSPKASKRDQPNIFQHLQHRSVEVL